MDDYDDQVPPPGKGSLYIRPLLMGSGQILGLGAAPEYTFLVYVSPVGNYFKVKAFFCFPIKIFCCLNLTTSVLQYALSTTICHAFFFPF